jgi:hypothetical protein
MKTFITPILQRDLEHYPGNLRRTWYLSLIVTATIVFYCDGTITSTVLPLVLHAFHLSLVGYSLFAVFAILLSARISLFLACSSAL